MIKKLRIRIILSSISAFAIVILFISTLVNVVFYRALKGQEMETLTSIINFESQSFDDRERPAQMEDRDNRKPRFPKFMGINNPEAEYITRFFVAKYDNDGNITELKADNIADVSKEITQELASLALMDSSDSDVINEYRYLKGKTENGNIIVFLNILQDQQNLSMVRLTSLAVSLISLSIVLVLVIIFSGAAIKPIVNNITKQKQFITDASHELKTPITSIVTSLDVITLDHGEDEWTSNIRNQTNRMSKLVSELVSLSRLDETNPLYVKENFSVSDISWEILEIYQSRAKAKGRMITANIEENLCMNGDKGAIGQMLSVLLDNAIKYAKGEGDTYFKVYGYHNKIKIEVSNPTEFDEPVDVKRLFDRFYRPDSSRNVDDGGSGIGLAIAKAVVSAHGGKISAECSNGKRMTLKVVLQP